MEELSEYAQNPVGQIIFKLLSLASFFSPVQILNVQQRYISSLLYKAILSVSDYSRLQAIVFKIRISG